MRILAITMLLLLSSVSGLPQAFDAFPRTTTATNTDLILIQTNSAGLPGQKFTRSMELEDLLNQMQAFPNWPSASTLTATNVPDTNSTILGVFRNKSSTVLNFRPIKAGSNSVLYIDTDGAISINGQPGSGGGGGGGPFNTDQFIAAGGKTSLVSGFKATNANLLEITNRGELLQVGDARFQGSIHLTNANSIISLNNSTRIDLGRNSAWGTDASAIRLGSNSYIASLPEGLNDNSESNRMRGWNDTTGNDTNRIVLWRHLSNYVATVNGTNLYYEPESMNYFARAGVTNAEAKGKVDGFIKSLKTANLWTSLTEAVTFYIGQQNPANGSNFATIRTNSALITTNKPAVTRHGLSVATSIDFAGFTLPDTRTGSVAVVVRNATNTPPAGRVFALNSSAGSGHEMSIFYDGGVFSGGQWSGGFAQGFTKWNNGFGSLASYVPTDGCQGAFLYDPARHTLILTTDNNRNMKSYCDGVLTETVTDASIVSNILDRLTVGTYNDFGSFANASPTFSVGCIAVFNKVLSDAEAKTVEMALTWLEPATEHWVFEGDSLLYNNFNLWSNDVPHQLHRYAGISNNVIIHNVAQSGQSIATIATQTNEWLRYAPGQYGIDRTRFFLGAGVNDLLLNSDAATNIFSNIVFTASIASRLGMETIVMTPPQSLAYTNNQPIEWTNTVNLIMSNASVFNYVFPRHMIHAKTNANYYNHLDAFGIHYNAAEYRKEAEELIQMLYGGQRQYATLRLDSKTPNPNLVFGTLWADYDHYNPTSGVVKFFDGSVTTTLIGINSNDTPGDQQIPKYSSATGKWTYENDGGGGGGGSPAGGSGDVQFSFGSAFGGTSRFNYDSNSSTLALTVSGNTSRAIKIRDDSGGSNFDLYLHPRGIVSSNGSLTLQAGSSASAFSTNSFSLNSTSGKVAPVTDARQPLGSLTEHWSEGYFGTTDTTNLTVRGGTFGAGKVLKDATGNGVATWQDDNTGAAGSLLNITTNGITGVVKNTTNINFLTTTDIHVVGSNVTEGADMRWNVVNDAITFAKMQNLTSDRLVGRDTAGTGDPEEITVTGGLEFTGGSGIQRSALTGDVTAPAGNNVTTIANDAVTYAKIQNVGAASRLLGRGDSGSGDPEEITIGAGLVISGTTLNATDSINTNFDGLIITNAMDRVWVWQGKSTNQVIDWSKTNSVVFAPSGTVTTITFANTPAAGAPMRELALWLIWTNAASGSGIVFPTGSTIDYPGYNNTLPVVSGLTNQYFSWTFTGTNIIGYGAQSHTTGVGPDVQQTNAILSHVAVTNATPNRVAVFAATTSQLTNSAAVDLTELEFLDGVTSSVAAKDAISASGVSATDANFINGDDFTFSLNTATTPDEITGIFSRTVTLGGNPALSANHATFSTTGLIFEGSTADTIETLLTAADPTSSDKTITLPNASGTVAVSATSGSGITLGALGDIGTHAVLSNAVATGVQTNVFDTIYIDAAAMVSNITAGATFSTEESQGAMVTTNKMLDSYVFDGASSNSVQFKFAMPMDWDASTVKVRLWTWSTNNVVTTTNIWGISAVAITNGIIVTNIVWGTERQITNVVSSGGGAAKVSNPTESLTIASVLGAGQPHLVLWRVRRLPGDANDNDSGQQKLLGAWVQYKRTLSAVAQWQ